MKALYIVFFFIVAILFSACMKTLEDFEFEDKDPIIVVHAKFNPDSVTRVFVSRSLDMFDRREIKVISGASVKLFSGNDSLAFNNDNDGWYSLAPGSTLPGNNYRLEIEAQGYPTASSEFYVPLLPEISRVDTSKIREVDGEYYYGGSQVKGKITLHFEDNPDTEDFYVVSMKSTVVQVDFNEVSDTSYITIFSNITTSSPYLEVFYNDYMGYQNPPIDDVWGVKKLIFSDRLFNGKADVSIDILFQPEYRDIPMEGEIPEEIVDIYFSSIDKHLFEYARTKAEMYRVDENPLAEPVTPYSPVSNGFGLVYGLTEQKIEVNITGLFSAEDYGYGGYY